jgi:hypothetical protein
VARHDDSLISQIERDALDDAAPLATVLRKCVVLAGKSRSDALRDWATRELKGYGGEDELPDYRVINTPLLVDGIAGGYKVMRQQLAPSAIPDFARDVVSERLELRYGVGNIEALLQQADIMLQPPGASDLVRFMNGTNGASGQYIERLYWAVSAPAIRGVLDQIRTALTQLTAELRSMRG